MVPLKLKTEHYAAERILNPNPFGETPWHVYHTSSVAGMRVSLFLRQRRTERKVDFALDRGAAIVVLVNGARQFDETRPKILGPLAGSKIFLDLPKRFVHFLQLLHEVV